MAFRMSTALKNAMDDRVIEAMAGSFGTAGSASLALYNGTQPATADEAAAGTLLATIDGICWSQGSAGTAVLASTAGYAGTATSAGTVTWGRLSRVDGTYGTACIDGDVGTAGFNVFTINVANVSSGGIVTLLDADIYMA